MRFNDLLDMLRQECRWCGEDIHEEDPGVWVDRTDGDGCSGDDELRNEDGVHEPMLTDTDFEWVICGRCQGEGVLGGYPGVYTSDDFAEDPDLYESYMTHSRVCEPDFSDPEGCGGSGKIRQLTEAALARPEIAEMRKDHYETEAIYAAERRAGA